MERILFRSRTDAELVREALADSPRAFEALVLRYQRKAYGIARAMAATATPVDDVVQEAFLRAFRELPSLRAPEAFGAWFLAIVRNTSRKGFRREGSRAAPETLERLEAPEAEGLEGEEFRDLLWRRVAELPQGIREAIFLYYHENRSVRAVARALGTSGSAVKARLKHGRDLLRERLWRELRTCLRDMLPSTREWNGRGRKLALYAMASLPPAWALQSARTASALSIGRSTLGVSLMTSKKLALGVSLTALLFLGGIAVLTDPLGLRQERATPLADPGSSPGVERPGSSGREAAEEAASRIELPGPGEGAEAALAVSILGRVSSGGRPVPLARIIALDLAAWERIDEEERKASALSYNSPARLRKLREAYLGQAKTSPRTTSGPDGSFSLRGLPDGLYRVIASHQDYLPGVDGLATVRAGAPARCDLELVPGFAIAGKVVDESGRCVAGAALEADTVERSALQGADRLERIRADWREGRPLLSGAAAESGPDGSFRLVSLEPTGHDLTARKEGYLEARAFGIPAGSGGVVLILERGAALTGRVLDPAGAPVANAQVVLARTSSSEVHRIFDWSEVETDPARNECRGATDSAGRFRLEGLTAGTFDLSVSADAFPTLEREVAHSGAPLDLGDLVLEEARSISGTVYGPAGDPVAGARVWAARPGKGVQPSNSLRLLETDPLAEARSGAGGRFSLNGLREGSFEVRAAAEGFSEASAAGVPGGEGGLKLVLGRGLRVQGTVIDADTSAPVSGAEVRLGIRREVVAETDARGVFRASGLPLDSLHHGTTTLRVSHPDFDTYQDWNTRVLGRDEKSPLRISLTRSERISGRVTDPSGGPAAGAAVWIEVLGLPAAAMGYNPARDLRAVADGEGGFSLPAPGSLRSMMGDIRFSVVASHLLLGRGRTVPLSLPPTGANWPEVEIALGGSSIEGRVTDEEGRPVASARVACRRRPEAVPGGAAPAAAEPAGSWDGPVAYTGPDGSYRIGGAEPGPCEVLASALGFAPRRVGGLELGAFPLRADLVLERGKSVEGRVLDSYGAGIAGAEVLALERPPAGGPGADASEFVQRMALLKAPSLASARSGADGRFRLEHLAGRSVTIAARAEGHEAAALPSVEPGASGLELVLSRFGIVAGRVLSADRKQPVTRFLLDVLDKKKLPAAGGNSFRDYRVASEGELSIQDPQGEFLYDGLRPGEYLILASAPGFDFALREVSIQGGEEADLEILLDPGLRVEGVVLDAETGEPVTGANIMMSGRSPGEGIRPFPQPLSSGEDGSFSLGGLRAGSYLFNASHPYYLHSSVGPVDVGAEGAQRIELKLSPAGRLEGRIRGLSGGQMDKRGVVSTLMLENAAEEGGPGGKRAPGPSFNRIWADPEGRYAAENLKPGRYVLKVKKQEMERGETVHLGPSGGFVANRPVGPEEVTVLGEVEIRARETTVFDAAAR